MNRFFLDGEYILADSGYVSLEHIVPTFKGSHLNPLTPAQNHFNNALSKLRVASEKCNSMLKGRFGYSKEMHLVISNSKSAAHVCAWIAACVVLHNFLIVEFFAQDFGVDNLNNVPREDNPSEQAERTTELASAQGQRRTQLVSHFLLQHGY